MPGSQRGLGRGLDALLKGYTEKDAPESKSDITLVPLTAIVANPNQPRKDFPAESLNELAQSIKSQGVLQPILVRKGKNKDSAQYELIAGERRLRACQLAGLSEIPVILKDISDEESLIIAIIENLQREDLNSIDEAAGLAQLQQRLGLNQDELAQKVGKSRPAVANTLRLLQLPENIQNDLRNSVITAGHARSLLSVSDPDLQNQMYQRILDHDLTVRACEAMAAHIRENNSLPDVIEHEADPPSRRTKKSSKSAPDPLLTQIQDAISSNLKFKASLRGSADKGQLVLSFKNKEEFELILNTLGINYSFSE